jgi:class 3 adenylate cyclase/tetratricopeptide (TPR) repeat protein
LLVQPPQATQRVLGPELEILGRLLDPDGSSGRAVGVSTPTQTEQERLQLVLAMSRALIALAQRRPTLFIVDDLHWADRSSLELFGHAAFAAADMAVHEPVPLLMIGTYRPLEAGDHLARLIARLQRESICRTLTLPGLNESEIRDLIRGMGLMHPSHQLTAAVSEATRGNPLFIQEVVHHLVQERALEERRGYMVTTVDPADLLLPAQLTGAIVARIQRLSEDCRRALPWASSLGDRFAVQTLSAVSDRGEDELLDLLEEGRQQRLLLSEGQTFQFAHPLIRHVLYREPSAARRQRIHARIAQTLQRLYADDVESHVLEIAHHLVRAGPAADPDLAVHYTRRAGDKAFAVFAWSDASRYYEAALLASASSGALSRRDRADLHYRAALARLWDGDVGLCRDHYEKAIAGYRQIGDLPGLARALMVQARAYPASVAYGTLVELQPLEEVLQLLGESEPGLRASILLSMSQVYWVARQPDKAAEMAQRALAIGQELKDDQLCAFASFELGVSRVEALQVREGLECYQRSRLHAQRAHDRWFEGWPLQRMPTALMLLGRFEEVERVALEAYELAAQTNNWSHYSLTLAALAYVALARGDFQAVERYAQQTMAIVSRCRYPFGGAIALSAVACARALRGAWADAESALDQLVEPGYVFENPGHVHKALALTCHQLVRAYKAAFEEKPRPSAVTLQDNPVLQGRLSATLLAARCALVEMGALGAVRTPVEPFYRALSQANERGVVFSRGWMFLIPRVLGLAACADRRWDVAEAHFQAAIDVAANVGARPELGRTFLDYARLLTVRGRRGDRSQARTLIRQAGLMFRELGMEPFARGAERLAERVAGRRLAAPVGRTGSLDDAGVSGQSKEPTPAAEGGPIDGAAPSLRIILVTDIEGSTALLQRLGDAPAHALVRRHNAIIRHCLQRYHGAEVTHTGDGIEAAFASAANAVACAVAIQQAFARHNRRHPERALRVRIGLNAGEPLPTEERLFGTAVSAACRICARAQPGQILVADVVRQLAAGKGFAFVDRGRVGLKGLPGRVRLYEVRWESASV